MYEKINAKYGNQFTNEFIKNWKRFLDDCFITWTVKMRIIRISLYSDIKFTAECSDKQLPFLDVLVKKEGFKTETDIYYKPTQTANNTYCLIRVTLNTLG